MMPSRPRPTIASSLDYSDELLRGFLIVFALCDVLKTVYGADNASIAIPDWLNVNERDATRAVRSLNVDLLLAHGDTGAQHIGHGALMVRERSAVGAEHSIRSAKPFIGIADSRRSAP